MADVLDELVEPQPRKDILPFLGETALYELILSAVGSGKIVINVAGTWVGRLPEHQDDTLALESVRRRAFRSPQENRQARLGLPNMMGTPTVTVDRPSRKSEPPVPGKAEAEEHVLEETRPDQSGQPPVQRSRKSEISGEPKTGINLSACFETWGIPSDQPIETASIDFKGLTVQELKRVLQGIPSSIKAIMRVEYEKEDRP